MVTFGMHSERKMRGCSGIPVRSCPRSDGEAGAAGAWRSVEQASPGGDSELQFPVILQRWMVSTVGQWTLAHSWANSDRPERATGALIRARRDT